MDIALAIFLICFLYQRVAVGTRTILASSADSDEADVASNYPLRCLVRQFNFTATVTDASGKRCRGQVSTKACFGSCDSYEVGTFEFPWIVRVQPVCNYDSVVMKEVRLSDCDPGVDGGTLVYRFPEASSCSCAICDPKEQACETPPSKRSQEENRFLRYFRSMKNDETRLVDYRDTSHDNWNEGWMAWQDITRPRSEKN